MPEPRLLFLFVDGLGLAPDEDGNPLARVPTPAIERLLGAPLVRPLPGRRRGLVARELDAGLGVPGLPQSATGQTALFTGRNAPAELGFHQAAIPGARLIAILREDSIFRHLAAAGRTVAFANAFQRNPYGEAGRPARRLAATTRAMMAAGVPFRRAEHLRRGRAVSWDICGDRWRQPAAAGPGIEAPEAGRRLVRLAAGQHLTLFETFITDLAGHRRWGWSAGEALRRLDGLVAGVLEADDAGLTVLLTSDHGNVESSVDSHHTSNPVPLLAWGPERRRFARARSLLDVAPALRTLFGLPRARRRGERPVGSMKGPEPR